MTEQVLQLNTPVIVSMEPKWHPGYGVPMTAIAAHEVMGKCAECGNGTVRYEGTLISTED